MKKLCPSLLLFFVFYASAPLISQQCVRLGIDLKLNSATQLMQFPEIPNEGTFQANRLGTIGFGIFAETKVLKSGALKGVAKLNYIRKGFRLPIQYGEVFSSVYFEFDQKHTFDFLDLDLLLRYKFQSRFLPQISGGLRTGVLLAKKIGSDFYPFNVSSYPKEFYGYNKVSAGGIIGLSYSLAKQLSIGLETNLEFLPTINRDNFRARNWVTSFNISYYL